MKNFPLILSLFALCTTLLNAQSSYEFKPMMIDSYAKPYTYDNYEAKNPAPSGGTNPVTIVGTIVGTAAVATAGGLYIKHLTDKSNMEACITKTMNEDKMYYVYSTKDEDGNAQEMGGCVTCCATGLIRVIQGGIINCVKSSGQASGAIIPNPSACLDYNIQKEKVF